MSSQKWTENEIEKQFKQLPEITDHRSAADILARLQADERLQQVPQRKRRPIRLWLSVAAVAFVLISFTLPFILNWNATQFEQAADLASDEETALENESAVPSEARMTHKEEESRYAVQESVLADYVNVQLDYLLDEQMIPISLLIPVARVQLDFQNEVPTSFQLYEKYAGDIPEEALGFTPDLAFKLDERIQGHDQSASSLEQEEFEYTEENLSDMQDVYSFYAYENSTGQTYLVKEAQAGSTVVEALENMRESPSDTVQSLISEAYLYEIVVENEVAHIQFTEGLDLLSMDEQEAYRLIEGFMLTAAPFHLAVQFDNVSPLYFGAYDLTRPLPKPIGSNPIYLLDE